jgi:hypothetical protein
MKDQAAIEKQPTYKLFQQNKEHKDVNYCPSLNKNTSKENFINEFWPYNSRINPAQRLKILKPFWIAKHVLSWISATLRSTSM